MRNFSVLAFVLTLFLVRPALAGQAVLHMELGDPARKGREVPLVLDGITDTTTGEVITPAEMARRLDGVGLLFIGENHTDMDFHNVQYRTIRALHEAGREVLVALEMFPYTEQRALDQWHQGLYTEPGFVDLANWYGNWGYNWQYYRQIFLYAQEQGIRMFGVNSPREVIKAVRAKGFKDLTPEEAAHFPPRMAPESAEHQDMYRAFFDPQDALHMNAQALEGLYRAQTAWDATMGWNALQALKQHGGPKAIMVVLIGAGHVTFGLGAERQVAPYYDGRIASLIPVLVRDDEGKPVSQVRASYASFIWGMPPEVDTMYPSLGVSLMGSIGKEPGQIIQVSGNSVASRAGLRVGDVLLAIDGGTVGSETDLRRLTSDWRWGDVASARIRRDGREMDMQVAVRRATQ